MSDIRYFADKLLKVDWKKLDGSQENQSLEKLLSDLEPLEARVRIGLEQNPTKLPRSYSV
ncbi:MAG: hypothetical protein R2880_06685 [Deinococcales bacterium]